MFTNSFKLTNIGFSNDVIAVLKPILKSSDGGIFVVGPTGSGKSTTLKVMLEFIDNYHQANKIICSIEDPIEYNIDGVRQNQVLHGIGDGVNKRNVNYSNAINIVSKKGIDVILVSEIRDLNTANAVFRLIDEKHMVLSSLHSINASHLFPRMISDINIPINDMIKHNAVKAVISQRLVNVLCKHCRLNFVQAKKFISPKYHVVIKNMFAQDMMNLRFVNESGCEHCINGIVGRTGVFEILIPTDEYLSYIQKGDFIGASEFWCSSKCSDGHTGLSYVDDAVKKAKIGLVDPIYINDQLAQILDM
jgi:type II secretory ATPase GspE/PulE/Tfp pilus assembly ATPase PilB-like protein